MKKLLTIIILILLLAIALTACGSSKQELTATSAAQTTAAASPSPSATATPLPEPTVTASPTPPPTETPVPEPSAIVVSVDSTQPGVTCAGYNPILGGEMNVTVTTEDGGYEGLGKVEFFIEDMLAHSAAEPPYGFVVDTSEYEDGTSLTLKVDTYDTLDNMYQSESMTLRVDNTIDPSLKSLSEALGIRLGNHIEGDSNYQIPYDDTPYFETLCQNFNLITVDYGMYMSFMQPTQSGYDYSRPDQVVEFAEANNMVTRGHPLVDGANLDWINPETDWLTTSKWVHDGDFSREEMIEIMYERIERVMTHYKGQINEWVVVNETFGGFNGKQGIALKNNVWTQKLGDDYVELALKYARQVDPDATLILNEVNVDYLAPWNNRVDGFYSFVVDLLEKGTPIDIVGFQFHWIVGEDNPTVKDIVDNFARYGELGLEVSISEMDVRIEKPVTAEKLEEQARLYAIALQACLESEYCTSFSVWSHSDKYSWIPNTFPGFEAAHLFDEDHQPKPAYFALIEVMETYLNK